MARPTRRRPESYPVLVRGAGQFLSYAEPHVRRIEQALEGYLQGDGRRPEKLYRAMEYGVLSGGKRLRPLLCAVAAEIAGKTLEDVLPTACALELIHAFSLIHDDLPDIDDDSVRRGVPTCHVEFGPAIAILAGDALLALAFELLAQQRKTAPADRVLEVIELVSRAIGREGMAAGEVEDLLAEGAPGDLATLEAIHEHKSADFIRASLVAGAVLAGASKEVQAQLSTYGACIGLAFQIMDDILGETGDPAQLGKPVGRDEERQKLTYPRLLGARKSRQIAEKKAHQALASIADLGPAAEPLRGLALYVLHRSR